MSNKKGGSIGLAAIMSIGFVMMAFTATTPAMGALVMHFPEVGQNISLLSNGQMITVIPMTLIAGMLTSSGKLKFRVATIIGSILLFIGGVAPALINGSFEIILVWKLIFGVGLGLLTPLANALVMNLYEGDTQAKYLGWVTLLTNFGGILFQMLGGMLADTFGAGPDGTGWSMHFWAYSLTIVAVIFAFFIPEPDIKPAQKGADGQVAKKAPLNSIVFIAGGVLFLVNVVNFPVMMYMANIFMERGIGGDNAATAAATALSMFTVAGMVAGATYGSLFKVLNRFIIPAGFAVGAAGLGLIFIASNVLVATCGTVALGFGFSLVVPSFFTLLGMRSDPSRVTISISIAMAIMNVGALAATPYLGILEGIAGGGLALYNTIIVLAAIAFAVLALAFAFVNLYPKAPADAQ